jgi:predicted transcriptional regulator
MPRREKVITGDCARLQVLIHEHPGRTRAQLCELSGLPEHRVRLAVEMLLEEQRCRTRRIPGSKKHLLFSNLIPEGALT